MIKQTKPRTLPIKRLSTYHVHLLPNECPIKWKKADGQQVPIHQLEYNEVLNALNLLKVIHFKNKESIRLALIAHRDFLRKMIDDELAYKSTIKSKVQPCFKCKPIQEVKIEEEVSSLKNFVIFLLKRTKCNFYLTSYGKSII